MKNYYFGVSLGLFFRSLVQKGRATKNTHAAREGVSYSGNYADDRVES